MTANEILDALSALLPAAFESTLFKLGVPVTSLSGIQAAQSLRATEVVQWLTAQNRLPDAAKLLQSPRSPPAAREVSTAHLPSTAAKIFGREAELTWLDECWDEGANVATVVAWGGVGKTSLVNTWWAKLRDDGWRGAERVYAWSFYSQGTSEKRVTSAEAFVNEALRWFKDPDPAQGSAWEKGQRLAWLVREKRTLLILDGMEPLQAGPGAEEGKIRDQALQALVKELAADNSGLCLITTRIAVADLGGGTKIRHKDLDRLSDEMGAALLEARGTQGTTSQLCTAANEFGGHALALTLLGSYLEDACEGDIQRRREIGPLEEDERLGGHAKRVMVAYERWFQGGPEIAILRMLGLFDRPADKAEIAALRDAPGIAGLTNALTGVGGPRWSTALTKLRRSGLLSAKTLDKKLDAHPLVREHFGTQIRQTFPDAWREGHRRLYLHLKSAARQLPSTIEEMAPLYSAVIHGCQAGKHQEVLHEIYAARINRTKDGFNVRKLGAFGGEVAVLSAFFDPPWDNLAPGLSEQEQGLVMYQAGFALRGLGRLTDATELLRMALTRSIAQEDWANAAIAAGNLSDILLTRGELVESHAIAQQSNDLADKSDDPDQCILRKTTLAVSLQALGLQGEAIALFEEAERMHKERDPAHPLLYSRRGFFYCDLLLDQGRTAEAERRALKLLEWRGGRDSLLDIALRHLSLGRTYFLVAQFDAAADLAPASGYVQQAVDGLRRAGHQDHLPLGLLARAALRVHTRDLAAAHVDLEEALSLATRCGFRLHEADAHLGYARLHIASAELPAAREHRDAARAIIDATGYHRRDEELARLDADLA